MPRILFVTALAVLAMTIVSARQAPVPDPALMTRARALQKQTPLIDGHNDFPWALRQNNPQRDLNLLDISKPQPSIMTDIPRLRQGELGAQFWSVYVPVTLQGQTAVTATLEEIDTVYQMMHRYSNTFELARTPEDVHRIFKQGKIASMIGVEGGHSIDDSLGTLRMLFALGARYMTLTHEKNTDWADSCTDTPKFDGLAPFGEEVVREMNRLGMLVDLSHTAPATMEDAIRVSAAPVIFSHSAAKALNPVPRNVPDNVLEMLRQNGGVVMVTFVPGFLSPKVTAWNKAQDAERARLTTLHPNDAAAVKGGVDAWTAANPMPRATVSDIADHIDHIRQVAGIDHIGIGSDFDGITQVPLGMEDVSTYPTLTAELLRRGYSDVDVRKILGENLLRVWRQVDVVAKKLQAERGPSTAIFTPGS